MMFSCVEVASPRPSLLPPGKLALLGNPLECFADGLDPIEKIAPFCRKQAQDLVLQGGGRHAEPPGIVVDKLADFELVL